MSEPTDPEWNGRSPLIQRIRSRDSWRNEPGRFQRELDGVAARGGLLLGIPKEEGWLFIPSLWRFDYMGNASFEWGQPGECLEMMKGYHADPTCGTIVPSTVRLTFQPATDDCLELRGSGPTFREKWRSNFRSEPFETEIHLLCFDNHIEPLTELMKRFQAPDHGVRCIEEPFMWKSFMATDPKGGYGGDIHGWFEINQGWLAFKDKGLFLESAKALGISI